MHSLDSRSSTLRLLGWNSFFAQQLTGTDPGLQPARVLSEHSNTFIVRTVDEEFTASAAGRLRSDAGRLPAAGDWVLLNDRRIVRILEPRTALQRKVAGRRSDLQVLASNVDVVLVVTSANRDLNPRRIERYLVAAARGGAEARVLLSKADLPDDPAPMLQLARSAAHGIPVHPFSAHDGWGLDAIRSWVPEGSTAALVGSSGVGKSTLLNALVGHQEQAVKEVRADDARGRHTTTSRRMVLLAKGGWLMDTPGMRELGLPGGEDLAGVFDDVDSVARSCRFRDCRHEGEPGCAIDEAIEGGTLDADRVEGWARLAREEEYESRRRDERTRRDQKIRNVKRTKANRLRILSKERRGW
jgi:ribosome biogenesis GTPase / thiamine phosphate phosphatase